MGEKNLIYAVDDEASLRDLYRYALEDAGFEVGCFANGDEFFDALKQRIPQAVLLDIMLDGQDGYAILSALRKSEPTRTIPVIMVSAKGEEVDKVRGLNLGADDYLSKPFGVLELVARIRANLRRCGSAAEMPCSYKGILIDEKRHEIRINGEPAVLTAKEYALLSMLVYHAGTALARNRILDEVWGENYGETRTLDLHIAQVRRRIVGSGAEIRTIRGMGYMLE